MLRCYHLNENVTVKLVELYKLQNGYLRYMFHLSKSSGQKTDKTKLIKHNLKKHIQYTFHLEKALSLLSLKYKQQKVGLKNTGVEKRIQLVFYIQNCTVVCGSQQPQVTIKILIKVNLKNSVPHTSHISSAQQPHVASGDQTVPVQKLFK